jgi:hypothetical protein
MINIWKKYTNANKFAPIATTYNYRRLINVKNTYLNIENVNIRYTVHDKIIFFRFQIVKVDFKRINRF